jgi:hypothetical protein
MGDREAGSPGLGLFFVLFAPFALNDFANIFIDDFGLWLVFDYASRLIVILAAVLLVRTGRLGWDELGFRRLSRGSFAFWAVLMSVLGIAMDKLLYQSLTELMPWWKLGSYPIDETHWFYAVDLVLGLVMVAVSEEIVSRGLAASTFGPRIRSRAMFYLLTSLLFGLAHWSHGPGPILATAVIGAAFMFCLRRTGSIWPVIVAHFAVNFWYFG